MKKLLTNPVSYVVLYLLFMIPTYILPYFGSNSYVMQGAASAIMAETGTHSSGLKPLFYLHFLIMLILVMIVWLRACEINKKWIVIFPILALAFDLLPVINNIPWVPTIMHLIAIIMGVRGNSDKAKDDNIIPNV